MSTAERVGQMMMAGFDGTSPPPHILDWLASGRIGGVYLFAHNVESPEQVAELVMACREAARQPILVGIDQEGGTVARLRHGFTESPGAMALASSRDAALAEDVAAMLGREMRALGINWNFAPVADLARSIANPSIGTRSLGRDKNLVSDFVIAQIEGFQREGVAATVKHFPGLGSSVMDTHVGMAKISDSLRSMTKEDIVPFRRAIENGVACVMTTHAIFEELDSRYPATLSATIIDGLLRGQMGYDGPVCTDCMEMKAVTDGWGAGESAVLSVLAGVDMLLFSHTRAKQEDAFEAVLGAVESGRITQERIMKSVARIDALKSRFPLRERPPLDIIACEAHRELARKAARAGIVLLRRHNNWRPIATASSVICVEFAVGITSKAEEDGADSAFTGALRRRIPQAQCCVIRSEDEAHSILATLEEAEVLVLATRDAHRMAWQAEAAQSLIDRHPRAILLCLRDPYDAAILAGAEAILCSHGDSEPSLQSAVDALCGDYEPSGEPVYDLESLP